MNLKGEAYVLISCVIFSTLGLFTRELSKEMGLISQVSFRISMACLIYFLIFSMKGMDFLRIKKKEAAKMFIAGFFGYGLMVTLITLSFLNTTYGNAATFLQVTPIIVLILGWMFLKEKAGWKVITCALLAVIGAIIIFRPDMSGLDNGVVFALFAALMNAVYLILVRGLRNVTLKSRLFYLSLFGGVVFLPFAFLFEEVFFFSMKTWGILLLMALANVIGYYFLNKGIKILDAGTVSIIGVSQAVFGITIGYLLGENFSAYGLVGAAFIVASIVLLNIDFQKISANAGKDAESRKNITEE
jgi:drug/metabolite transporter (DMT)-like permease